MDANIWPIACDLLAITVVAGIYFRRHQRRDLLLAYVALNVGILSVTALLTSASVGAGLGLGLFGILSIIRLRSDSITQEEIAYYFVALALGLLAGVAAGPIYLVPLLSGLLVLVMYVVDHPRLLPRARRQLITLDSAIPNEAVLRAHIESRFGFEVRHLIVQELDLVRDVTVVDVRYRIPSSPVTVPSDLERADGRPIEVAGRPHAGDAWPIPSSNHIHSVPGHTGSGRRTRHGDLCQRRGRCSRQPRGCGPSPSRMCWAARSCRRGWTASTWSHSTRSPRCSSGWVTSCPRSR